MLSGIGIAVIIVTIFSQRRIKSIESMLKPKTEVQPRLFGDETKTAIKDKIDEIGMLTEEDFDMLITMMKSLCRPLLEESKNLYKCSKCGNVYYSKPKFCTIVALSLLRLFEKIPT